MAGYLTFAVAAAALFKLTGQNPHGDADPVSMLTSVILGFVFAVVGGYVAARLIPQQPRRHAAGVGLLIAIGAMASMAMSNPQDATWSQFAALTIMAPGAAAAGALVTRRL